jgi:hypothetical protein
MYVRYKVKRRHKDQSVHQHSRRSTRSWEGLRGGGHIPHRAARLREGTWSGSSEDVTYIPAQNTSENPAGLFKKTG